MRILIALVFSTTCAFAQTGSVKDLFTAIRNNDLSAIKALAAKEGAVNARGDRDTTPLMYASAYGSLNAMKVLLDAGADVNLKNAFDATALIWSVNEPQKVKLLLEHHANVNAASKTGRTPLMIAALHNGSDSVVDLLLANGADAKARDKGGMTFLFAASSAGNSRQVRIALDKGADANGKDQTGFTPLMNAAAGGDVPSVKLLLSKGADPNAISAKEAFGTVKNGPINLGSYSALSLASVYGPVEIVDLLLKAGAKVDSRDVRGMTPLHFAVTTEAQNPEIVRLLLKAGADPSAISLTGETAVEWAAKTSVPGVMKLLPVHSRTEAAVDTSKPDPDRTVRSAATRSLQLLQTVSNSFMNTGGCVACHAQNLNALAAQYAKANGFTVDEPGLKEQLAAEKAAYSRRGDNLLLRFDGGGGMDSINYALLHLSAAGYQADSMTDAMVHNLIAEQMADGSWHSGGGARAPMQDSDISRTALAIRGIKQFMWDGRKADLTAHVDAARVWLLHAKPIYNEDYVMQLLGLKWAGDQSHTGAALTAKLIAQQMPDGGWAQTANLRSDAYATGQTLLALSEAGGIRTSDSIYQRGVKFLLRTQHDDGSWLVRSRCPKLQPYFQSGFPYDHDQWISMAGTAWAAIALTLAAEPALAKR